jgi:hypothetical protein
MKIFISLLACCLGLLSYAQVQQPAVINPGVASPPPTTAKKIQIAILFDTSGSMDGLIEQAKTTIWQIVNAASQLRVGGATPKLEIALYDYGNSTIANQRYVRKHVDLISDLDSISGKLFGLFTNGGDEYCGAVIEDAMAELNWSTDPQDLKIIYIAGNEPFNQGPADYKVVLKNAATKGIIVNTIYCGPYDQGVREFWYDGALISQGNYFNIDSNREAFSIETPYDKDINTYNDSLNTTYMGYGSAGEYRMEKQVNEDNNAGSKGVSNKSERAVSKSNANYDNSGWDLIDAQKQKDFKLDDLKQDELPKELQGKTREEQEKIIAEKAANRSKYQENINELAKKRSEFIQVEKEKRALESGQEDLGTSIIKSMNVSAEKQGYTTGK